MPEIFTNKHHVGTLAHDATDGEILFPVFTYNATAGAENIVALNMQPSPRKEYAHRERQFRVTLHPLFAMNLPGPKTRLRQMLTKPLPIDDDYPLFEVIGRSQIGRLRVAHSTDSSLLDAVPETPLYELLKSREAEDIINKMFERYAPYSGVSGIQPKVLARDNGSLAALSPPASVRKPTASGTTHIVKFFDPDEFPAIAINEYLCLQAAKAAEIPVADTWISDDFQRLIIARFDINSDGAYMGQEDCCALENFQPGWKYIGSYEQVAKSLMGVIAPAHVMEDMALFFRSLTLSIMVRNGEAHRKNFAVIYNTAADVRLSPAYDIVTTTPYMPDFLALTLGDTKRWPDAKRLIQFGVQFCGMTPAEAKDTIAKVEEGVSKTRKELVARIGNAGSEDGEAVLNKMLRAWEKGLAQTHVGVASRLLAS